MAPAMALTYDTADTPTAADALVVDEGLDRHNRLTASLRDVRPLGVFARDGDGRIVGGAIGRTWGACAELQQLWVDEAARRAGVGSQLVARFEDAVSLRGCGLVYLDTLSFQAPDFYRRLGYEVALATGGYPEGIEKYRMHKKLAPR